MVMKKSRLAFLVGVLFLLPTFAGASFPPPSKTLEQRVELATHVIIGTAKKVTVVEYKDGKLEEMKPEPKILEPRVQWAQIEIEIEEVLYPLPWKATRTVKYLFGGGWFETESIRKDTLNKKFVYLMMSNPYPDLQEDNIFFPSYEWHMADPIEQKPAIQAALAERVQREEAKKAKAAQEQPKDSAN